MGKNSGKWNDVSKNQVNIIRKQNPARMQDSKEFCYQSDLKIGEKKMTNPKLKESMKV